MSIHLPALRGCELRGWGTSLPSRTVSFGTQTRYRIEDERTQLDLLAEACEQALASAGISSDDIDCIIGASAAGIQPLPCTAALVMERIAPNARAAAFDVNSTCTSFITAVDVASRYLAAGDYERILVFAGDVATRFLNPAQRESFELFSDAGAAVVLTRSDTGSGVRASLQQTWPAHAHDTELRGGLSAHPAQAYATGDPADYLFDMQGRRALMGMLKVLPEFLSRFLETSGMTMEEIDLVIPHQASGALALAMRRLGVPPEKYVDHVASSGNMVSSSVPYMLAQVLDEERVGRGDTVLLLGTAAGLTANALALRL